MYSYKKTDSIQIGYFSESIRFESNLFLICIRIYSSTTSSTSIGHAFAQMPQAIHLDAGLPSVFTIRPNGQASAHLPQLVHFFLVDHINTLWILGDCTFRTGFRTFAALWAGHWTNRFFFYDLDAGFVRVEFFIERLGTGSDTCQTCHTGTAFFYFQFLHSIVSSALSVMLPRNILNNIIVQQTVRK